MEDSGTYSGVYKHRAKEEHESASHSQRKISKFNFCASIWMTTRYPLFTLTANYREQDGVNEQQRKEKGGFDLGMRGGGGGGGGCK
jgi:hypothetical protein